jgi:predicted DNA binding CopG/RHH family protein
MGSKAIGKSQRRAIAVNVPHFKSESEEADWWYRNRSLVEDLLAKHGRRVGRNLELEVELKPAKLISIRLPEADIARAKKVAMRKGLPYLTYLRSVIHEGLAREERRRPRVKGLSGGKLR